jgi:hypothetical protein
MELIVGNNKYDTCAMLFKIVIVAIASMIELSPEF